MNRIAQYNKLLVTVLGLVLLVGADVVNAAQGFLPAAWMNGANIVLAGVTAFLTFWVRNETLVENIVTDVQHPTLGTVMDAAGKASATFPSEVRSIITHITGHASTIPAPPTSPVVTTTGAYPSGPYVPPAAPSPVADPLSPVPPVTA
jgi:hypothetical protein